MTRCLLVWLLLATSASSADVFDFGAVPNDGADDTAAFQVAANQGGVIRVPAGIYQLATKPGSAAVRCARPVRFTGESPALSIIRTERDLAATGHVFQIASGVPAEFSRLSIEGPAKVGTFYCRLFHHLGGSSGSLQIDRCTLSGGTHGVLIEDAALNEVQVVVTDCDIRCPGGLLFAGAGRLDLVRTRFLGYGLAGSNQAHAIYLYQPISARIDRCLFVRNAGLGFAIQLYSPTVEGRARVALQDCEFRGPGRALLTHADSLTVVRGCDLGEQTIEVQRGGVIISESTLQNRKQVKPWPYPPGPGAWVFRDCRFGE